MFAGGRGIQRGLKDGRQIANPGLLAQKLLQDFLYFAESEGFGNEDKRFQRKSGMNRAGFLTTGRGPRTQPKEDARCAPDNNEYDGQQA